MYSNATPSRNSSVPALTNATPNSADNINAQIQAILNRMQYNYNLSLQIAENQSALIQQYQLSGAGTIAPLLTQIAQEIENLRLQNISLASRFDSILPSLIGVEGTLATLTANASAIEAKGAVRKIGVNYQPTDPDLVAIAALSPIANRVIQSSPSNIIGLANPPNFGALPPSIYKSSWSPASGSDSGFTAPQANTWIVLPMAQTYMGSGYSHTGSRAIVPAGFYDIFAQVSGVGCVEFMCRLVKFISGSASLIMNGNTGHTVYAGGSLGSSVTVKSYARSTIELPACEIELQYKFKTPHSTAALSGGMPVSTPSLPEDFAMLRFIRI